MESLLRCLAVLYDAKRASEQSGLAGRVVRIAPHVTVGDRLEAPYPWTASKGTWPKEGLLMSGTGHTRFIGYGDPFMGQGRTQASRLRMQETTPGCLECGGKARGLGEASGLGGRETVSGPLSSMCKETVERVREILRLRPWSSYTKRWGPSRVFSRAVITGKPGERRADWDAKVPQRGLGNLC